MSVKRVLGVASAVGFLIAVTGCHTELFCPEARDLTEAAYQQQELQRYIEAIDTYRDCYQQEAMPASARKKIDDEIKYLTERFALLKLAEASQRSTDTVEQCDELIADLEQVLKYDSPNRTIQRELRKCRQKRQELADTVQRLLRTAMDQKHGQKWADAFSSIDRALVFDPANSEATDMRRKIIPERDSYYEKEINSLCAGDEWKKAASLLDLIKAEKPDPNELLIARLDELVQNTKVKIIRSEAEKLIAAEKYYTAYDLIKDADAPQCEDLLQTITENGGSYYMALANEEYRNVRDFHAYLAAVKALEVLGPNNEQAFKLHRDCGDRVDDSIQIKIGIAPFETLGEEPDAGKEFSNELSSYLHSALPYGIKIEERKKIEFGVEKVGAAEVVRLLGLKWAVFGDVQSSIVREREEKQVTTFARVPETVLNPEYERLKLEADRRREPGQPAEPFVTATRSEKVTYRTGEELMLGQITLSLRIYSADESSLTSSKNFVVTREVKDSFRDEVPEANIIGDPLKLPPQLTFMRELRQEMLQKVAEWLLKNFGERRKTYCEQAERFIQRREWDPAVRAAAQGYLYCIRDNVPAEDEWFKRLRNMALFTLTEGAPSD